MKRILMMLFSAGILAAAASGARAENVTAAKTALPRKTCAYCRQLMKEGKYRESIKSYRDFIRAERVKYQIDDAQYEIAVIYDSKLFEYDNALAEYGKLIREFPSSARRTIAAERIRYIKKHSGGNYAPLRRFEKLKAELFAGADRDTAVAKAESVLEDYPGTSLKEEVLLWLADNCGESGMEKSVSYYRRLIEEFPDSPQSAMYYTGLAGVFYSAGQYARAAAELESSLEKIPESRHAEVRKMISRAKRNIRRRYMLWVSLAVIILSVAGLFFVKPVLDMDAFMPGIISFCTCALSAALVFALRYQSLRKLVPLVLVLVPLFSAVPVISGMLVQKTGGVKRYVAGAAAVILLALAVSYSVIYYFNAHLLIVFRL